MMNKKLLISIGAGVLASTVGLLLKQTIFSGGYYVERYTDGRLIPPGGLLRNPYDLSNLVNDGEKDFRQLSKALLAYSKEKGVLPDDPKALIGFTKNWAPAGQVKQEHFFPTTISGQITTANPMPDLITCGDIVGRDPTGVRFRRHQRRPNETFGSIRINIYEMVKKFTETEALLTPLSDTT